MSYIMLILLCILYLFDYIGFLLFWTTAACIPLLQRMGGGTPLLEKERGRSEHF